MSAQCEGGVADAIAPVRTRIVPEAPEFAHYFELGVKDAQDVLALLKAVKPPKPFTQKPVVNLFECRFEVASIFTYEPNVFRSPLFDQSFEK